MLVLTRKEGEMVNVYDSSGRIMEVKVLDIKGGRVKLGFGADPTYDIRRAELDQQQYRAESLGNLERLSGTGESQ